MKIIIDGKEAVLKKGTSFEFVAENRSFTGSDSYTLSIAFPLRGCPENIAIFGHLNRMDADIEKVVFDCEINDVNIIKHGVLAIVDANDVEIKAQFLEGRSEQNFDVSFDEIYINELDLGSYPISSLPEDPSSQWLGIDFGQEAVALPWVNNSSGNIQNEVVYYDGAYSYHEDCEGLSFMPYLIPIVKRICTALGYSFDVSQMESREDLRYLIICNAIPWAWNMPQFAYALPHWSATEFFEKLEDFLGGEFNIDHKSKSIVFFFTDYVIANATPLRLDKVVNGFSSNVSTDDECNYKGSSEICYKGASHYMWKLYCCPWFLRYSQSPTVYDTLTALIEDTKKYARFRSTGRGDIVHNVFYSKDVDTYFIIRCIRNEIVGENDLGYIYENICVLQPINAFGNNHLNQNSDNVIELDFIPACIMETEDSKGACLFLEPTPIEVDSSDAGTRPDDGESPRVSFQSIPMQIILNGEKNGEKNEFFDEIYLAFWTGVNENVGKLPHPHIDFFTIREDWSVYYNDSSLRLSPKINAFQINPKHKYQFSFLSDTLPNPRAVFFIHGKKYLCEKITATFTENGMSQLLKGVFYRIVD